MEFTLKPIGYFYSYKEHKLEAARQSHFAKPTSETYCNDYILIEKQFTQALSGLETLSHIWVIFIFHKSIHEKLMVSPPAGSSHKMGVWATRSPHRPNKIGMSKLKILRIDQNKIYVESNDIINQTPVIDIKPYHPVADVELNASIGWLQSEPIYVIQFSETAETKILFLESCGLYNIRPSIIQQLTFRPDDHTKKRVQKKSEHFYVFSYRTWRVDFELKDQKVHVLDIKSGYSEEDLDLPQDPYEDKAIHRSFILKFKNCPL